MMRRVTAADGVAIALDDLGPADAPVVVLLHGGGQTRHSWAGAAAALAARGYRVLNTDLRGHGDSDWSADGAYALDDRVADLRAVLEGIDAPVALVGASLGGATAIHALASGVEAAALVLVDIVPQPEMAGVARIVSFMRAHPQGFASLDEAVDAVAAYNPERPRPRDPSGLMRNLRARDGRLYWHWDPAITATEPHVHHAIVQQSAVALAGREEIAVLLVRGLRSDVVSEESVAGFRALVPRLEVADVGGAGHMVAGDRNDAFNASVLDFLARRLPLEVTA